MNRHFFTIFFVISRLMIVLFPPDPATNRKSAILVVQFSDGTATQEFTGGLAVLAFFFLTASHFLPQLGRYHGLYACTIDPLDTQVSRPMQVCHSGAQERDPEHTRKGPLWGGSSSINSPSFGGKCVLGENHDY